MTLYRLDLDHEYFRWTAGLPEWLVPVELDYDKAEAIFQVVASSAIGLGLTPAVRAIVDAALGVGEETP